MSGQHRILAEHKTVASLDDGLPLVCRVRRVDQDVGSIGCDNVEAAGILDLDSQ